jgi:uncharacterized membrane protein YeaQ/YmgE (transglycosylase-associated protein family)
MMDMIIWGVAGAMLGWAAFTYIDLNEERGMVISMIGGAAGALLGGRLVAPMFGAVAPLDGGFSAFPLVIAALTSAACLFAADKAYRRFGI